MKRTDEQALELDRISRGFVVLDATPISYGENIFKRVVSILIRELGI